MWYLNENKNDKLLPKFRLKEFICHCEKCYLTTIDHKLLDCLDNFRQEYGHEVTINSAYRCQAHNKEIGGAKYSYHSRGQAIDLALPINKNQRELFIELAKKHFPVCRVYNEKNFIHCDIGEVRTW